MFNLAEAAVPAGIEVRESEDVVPKPQPDVRSQPKARVAASALVEAFNAARVDYRATLMEGVVVIRPVDRRARFLDSRSTITTPVDVVGTMQAVSTILSPLDPRVLEPGLMGGMGAEAARGLSARIALGGSGDRRVIDTLNQIVLQTPGAWKVTTRLRRNVARIVACGYIYAHGGFVNRRMPD